MQCALGEACHKNSAWEVFCLAPTLSFHEGPMMQNVQMPFAVSAEDLGIGCIILCVTFPPVPRRPTTHCSVQVERQQQNFTLGGHPGPSGWDREHTKRLAYCPLRAYFNKTYVGHRLLEEHHTWSRKERETQEEFVLRSKGFVSARSTFKFLFH